MKLSVIIPCFNAASTLAVQLEALANQVWSEPWEVILSDNGSTDGSVAIAEQYRDRLPHLRIVDASARRGAAHARNMGAKVAQGELLAFCDADDEVCPGWVAAMGEAIATYDFVAGPLEANKLNAAWILESRPPIQQQGLLQNPYLPHAASSNLGVKRSLYEAVGGFDESMYKVQDTDFCWRLQLAGTKLHFIPAAVVHYRYRTTVSGICRQARDTGKFYVLLYKKYRALGMSQPTFKENVRSCIDLVKRSPEFFSPKTRVRWLRDISKRIGRLQGCIEYRVLSF